MIARVSIRSSSWLEILTFKSDPKDDKGCHPVEWNTVENQTLWKINQGWAQITDANRCVGNENGWKREWSKTA